MNEKIAKLIDEQVLVSESGSTGYWSIYDFNHGSSYAGKLKNLLLINPAFNLRRGSIVGRLKRGPRKQKFYNEVNYRNSFTIGSSHTPIETSNYAEFRDGRLFV